MVDGDRFVSKAGQTFERSSKSDIEAGMRAFQ
jgi:hypothetical protein